MGGEGQEGDREVWGGGERRDAEGALGVSPGVPCPPCLPRCVPTNATVADMKCGSSFSFTYSFHLLKGMRFLNCPVHMKVEIRNR